MSIKVQDIPLSRLRIGHMMRHDGENKIVGNLSNGYPALDAPWSVMVTFTDSTQLTIPYPDARVTVPVISAFY